jgi:hypothetical protein
LGQSEAQSERLADLAADASLTARQRTPSTVLLSAQEAKDRLREIVKCLFFRRLRTEDGKRIRRLLVKIRAAESGRNPGKFHTPV